MPIAYTCINECFIDSKEQVVSMAIGNGTRSIIQHETRIELRSRIAFGLIIVAVCILVCCTQSLQAFAVETGTMQESQDSATATTITQDLQVAPLLTTQAGEIASGTSGTCKWVIDKNGFLTVSPKSGSSGALGTWTSYSTGAPWASYSTKIKAVRFEGTIEAKSCQGMFYGCDSLAFADLSNLDTSKATNMRNMFRNDKALTFVDLSSFDTSEVLDMSSMFDGCTNLISVNLSSFDVSKVVVFNYMFDGCQSLKYLDLSSFSPKNADHMSGMFVGCELLRTIYVSELWTTGTLVSSSNMFKDCVSLCGGNGTSYSMAHLDAQYARVDAGGKPGYLSMRYNSGLGISSDKRLSGDTALDTMNAIVDEGTFANNDVVVLTTADGYWDALTAAGLAGQPIAPVLMTDGKTLSKQTEKQLAKLKPSAIIVCGGKMAVSESVATAAGKAAGGAFVDRCAGDTATGTAVAIYKKGKEIGGTWSSIAFICTNDGYWDALAAAPISYSAHMPIFLTEGKSAISKETINAMKDGGIMGAYIVGGEAAIDSSVVKQLEGAGIIVKGRLWGDTAIETSEQVAAYGQQWHTLTSDKMGLATSGGYWDALAGAALCGKNGSVLLLVDGPSAHSITSFVSSNRNQIKSFYVFGGKAAISEATEKEALKAAK